MGARLRLPQHVRKLDELIDLAPPLVLRQPLPVRRQLAAVEVLARHSLLLQMAQVGGGRAREDVEAEAAKLELARGRSEDLARLLEHVLHEVARLLVDKAPAPAPLVAARAEELQNRGSSC